MLTITSTFLIWDTLEERQEQQQTPNMSEVDPLLAIIPALDDHKNNCKYNSTRQLLL